MTQINFRLIGPAFRSRCLRFSIIRPYLKMRWILLGSGFFWYVPVVVGQLKHMRAHGQDPHGEGGRDELPPRPFKARKMPDLDTLPAGEGVSGPGKIIGKGDFVMRAGYREYCPASKTSDVRCFPIMQPFLTTSLAQTRCLTPISRTAGQRAESRGVGEGGPPGRVRQLRGQGLQFFSPRL